MGLSYFLKKWPPFVYFTIKVVLIIGIIKIFLKKIEKKKKNDL